MKQSPFKIWKNWKKAEMKHKLPNLYSVFKLYNLILYLAIVFSTEYISVKSWIDLFFKLLATSGKRCSFVI